MSSIKFLYHDTDKDKVLEELDRIVKILQKPADPEVKKNVKFLRRFTKSLFIVSHKRTKVPHKMQTYSRQIIPQMSPVMARAGIPLPPPPPRPSMDKVENNANNREIEQNHISKLKKENGQVIFDIIEPRMEAIDWQIYNELRPIVKEAVKKDPEIVDRPDFIPGKVREIASNLKIKYSPDYIKKIKYYLEKNIKGFGKIDALMRDSRVKKIICSSYNELKVVFEGEVLPTNIVFDSNEELNNFILGVAEKYGSKVSETEPILKINLPNMDITAEYSPLTTSSFTIIKK